MKNRFSGSTKLMNNRTMSQELIVSIGLVFVCVWVLIGCVLFFMIKGALYHEKENLLESRVHNIAIENLVAIKTEADLRKNANFLMNEVIDPQIQCAVISSNGDIIAKIGNENINAMKKRLLLNEHPYLDNQKDMPVFEKPFYQKIVSKKGFAGFQLSENNQGVKFMSFFLKTGDLNESSGMIQMSTELTNVNNLIQNQMGIYAIISLFMLGLVMLVIRYVTRRTLLPLNKMKEVIEKFKVNLENMDSEKSQQLFQEQEKLNLLKGQAEVLALSNIYNEMIDAIQNAFERENKLKNQMRQFVSDASHELRTPLTSIHGFAEVLELGAYSNPEQLAKGLKSIMSESDRMNTLVTNLLTLNRLDQKGLTSDEMILLYDKINLNELLIEMAPQLQLLAGMRIVKYDINETVYLTCQMNGIKQVILNLFQNAIQHTAPETGVIEIMGCWLDDKVKITIQDNGKGIDPESMSKIFDRFYRGEKHRSREDGGYGLGLAIVKSIVEQHFGEISVESTLERGTKFILIFPA